MEQHPGKQGRRHRLDQQSNRRLRGRDTTQGVRDGCLPEDLRDHGQPDEPDPIYGDRRKQSLPTKQNESN